MVRIPSSLHSISQDLYNCARVIIIELDLIYAHGSGVELSNSQAELCCILAIATISTSIIISQPADGPGANIL